MLDRDLQQQQEERKKYEGTQHSLEKRVQDVTLACNNIALEKTKACEENIKLKEQNTKLVDLIHKFEKKV